MDPASKHPNWAILVAGMHARSDVHGPPAQRLFEIRQLVERAAALAAPERTCAIIMEEFRADWVQLAQFLAPLNLFVHEADQPLTRCIALCLSSIREREPGATAVLIPADHCAAVESTWISSARGALQLGRTNQDTVYMLHDTPRNDFRVSRMAPGVCSSSVVVGSIGSLIGLCDGNPATIVDLLVDAAITPDAERVERPLKVVHVSSIEEYTRLQRGDYGYAKSAQVDLHA